MSYVTMTLTKQDIKVLKALGLARSKARRKALLKAGGKQLYKLLRRVAFNILRGNVPITTKQMKKLKRHAKNVKMMAGKKTSIKKRSAILQRGGFLGALIAPILSSVAGSVLGGILGR